jgi:hypothetical protein
MTVSLRVRRLDAGLLVAASRRQRTGGPRIVHVPGLPADELPFWRVEVTGPSGAAVVHLLVAAHASSVPLEACRIIALVLRPAFPGALLSLERGAATGLSEMVAEAQPAEAAAAMAEVKRAAGWDGRAFRVVARQRNFDVELQPEAETSTAQVSEVSE